MRDRTNERPNGWPEWMPVPGMHLRGLSDSRVPELLAWYVAAKAADPDLKTGAARRVIEATVTE